MRDISKLTEWKKNNVDRIVMDVRKDAEVNKATIQKAADACGVPLVTFVAEAVVGKILSDLGQDWLSENGNYTKDSESTP